MEIDLLGAIRNCFESDRILYSSHARREMLQEEFGLITDKEVYETICSGEVIEEYPEDLPYPSALLFGMTKADRPLHVICAYDVEENRAVVVTVYQPHPDRWEDYRRRKR